MYNPVIFFQIEKKFYNQSFSILENLEADKKGFKAARKFKKEDQFLKCKELVESREGEINVLFGVLSSCGLQIIHDF